MLLLTLVELLLLTLVELLLVLLLTLVELLPLALVELLLLLLFLALGLQLLESSSPPPLSMVVSAGFLPFQEFFILAVCLYSP